MSTIAIVYHSGYGHTQALAEAVAKGAAGIKAKVWTDEELDAKAELLKRLGLKPSGMWKVGEWRKRELAVLGTDHDEVIAARIGRTSGVRGTGWPRC